jgi:hypothetical protein
MTSTTSSITAAKVVIVPQEYAHLIEETAAAFRGRRFLIAGEDIKAVPQGFEDLND